MTEQNETVVRVDTLKEYRAVLEKWFSKGYIWDKGYGEKYLNESYFTYGGARYLILEGNVISYSDGTYVENHKLKVITFNEFVAKERGKVTYEVSEEQMAFLHRARENQYPATYLVWGSKEYKGLFSGYEYTEEFERDLLKYVSGDENVVFKLNNPLYWLKGKDRDGDTVYFTLDGFAPTYVYVESDAFKAPRDEIVRWDNPFWSIEEVKEEQ